MERYQQPLYVRPTGDVVAIVSTTSATTTSSAFKEGLYYISNTADAHLNIDTAPVIEVQDITVTPLAGSVYELTVDSVVLTAAPLDFATLADLITKLQADVDYAAAPFTIAASDAGITITWKAIGVISITASLTEDGGAPINATETVAGVGTTCTTTNMLLPTGGRVFDIPNSAYISCIKANGASDGSVSITRCE